MSGLRLFNLETYGHCEKCGLKLHNRRKCPFCKIKLVIDEKIGKRKIVPGVTGCSHFESAGYDMVVELSRKNVMIRTKYLLDEEI